LAFLQRFSAFLTPTCLSVHPTGLAKLFHANLNHLLTLVDRVDLTFELLGENLDASSVLVAHFPIPAKVASRAGCMSGASFFRTNLFDTAFELVAVQTEMAISVSRAMLIEARAHANV
jgi:hypothetical protein